MIDWSLVVSGGAVLVSAAAAYGTYRRATKGDDALALSQRADRRSEETKTNLETQGRIIDQLQEELDRYRGEVAEKKKEATDLAEAVAELKKQLAISNAEAAAHNRTIIALKAHADLLEEQVVALRDLVRNHEETIARHERTISEYRMRLT